MPRINFAILIKSSPLPAWQFSLVKRVLESGTATVTLIVVTDGDDNSDRRPRHASLFSRINEIDERRNRTDDDARTPSAVGSLQNHCDVVEVHLDRASTSPPVESQLSSKLGSLGLDAVLLLEHLEFVNTFARSARWGAWYFEHSSGQTLETDGSTVGFWEVLARRPCVRSDLIVRDQSGSEYVAYRTFSAVHTLSIFRTRNEHLWKLALFVPRVLVTIRRLGDSDFADYLSKTPTRYPESRANQALRLTNIRILFPLFFYLLSRIRKKIMDRFVDERWTLLFSFENDDTDFKDFEIARPPDGLFWADPHPVRHNDDYFVFFEEASVATGKGHISVIQVGVDGSVSTPRKVLEKPYHLSYPNVFRWQGHLYMIPETADNRTIELYRCADFPERWEFVHNLMEGLSAYDATLLEHQGTWWLFANVRESDVLSSWDELCLYYSDSPISQNWQPHPANPVVSDVRRARPAGKVFSKDGKLYRPSQDSSHRYGYGLKINEIMELSVDDYREEVCQTVAPTWHRSARAVHTLNRVNQFTVIDAILRLRRH